VGARPVASPAWGERIPVGVSSCLLGQQVRYDGGHKHNDFLTGTLAQYFEFVPYCPELAIGLGVPRPPIRLVATAAGARARRIEDPSVDVTDRLAAYGGRVARGAGALCGYILKKGSPSCGMERVKVYPEKGGAPSKGRGIFAATLIERLPSLPVEEEGRLMDPVLRENFVERVFVLHRWKTAMRAGVTPRRLVEFHTGHKFSLLAHDEPSYRRLGRLVADAGKRPIGELAGEYLAELMQALARPATRRRHANVLNHLAGFFRKKLDAEDRSEIKEIIDRYRQGLVPLVVPITLLKHHLRRHPDPYLAGQHYLDPHPAELMLRNAV